MRHQTKQKNKPNNVFFAAFLLAVSLSACGTDNSKAVSSNIDVTNTENVSQKKQDSGIQLIENDKNNTDDSSDEIKNKNIETAHGYNDFEKLIMLIGEELDNR